mmetsp:Transcript_10316/g.17311  ORF Transcript_10316/g.17311 Transcript_10316/m.17311 type:complete len:160 (+) Transcript_10316:354-833(+)
MPTDRGYQSLGDCAGHRLKASMRNIAACCEEYNAHQLAVAALAARLNASIPPQRGSHRSDRAMQLHCNSREDRIVAADGGTNLLVLLTGMYDILEFGGRCKHRSAKPDGEALHVVRDDVDVNGLRLYPTVRELRRLAQPLITAALDVPLQPASEVFEHG